MRVKYTNIEEAKTNNDEFKLFEEHNYEEEYPTITNGHVTLSCEGDQSNCTLQARGVLTDKTWEQCILSNPCAMRGVKPNPDRTGKFHPTSTVCLAI